MSNWKENFLTPKRTMRLFKVGHHNMMLGDLVQLGFRPEDFEEVTSPWARKTNYDVKEIAKIVTETLLRAQARVQEKK
jgi:uncharacterized protein (DUF111 family)